jgi:ABC-type transport system involved in cytochrome bd biosynthesis fused ATPase/permease subunit
MLKRNTQKVPAEIKAIFVDNVGISPTTLMAIFLLIYFIIPFFSPSENVRAIALTVYVLIIIFIFSYNYKKKHGNNLAERLNAIYRK